MMFDDYFQIVYDGGGLRIGVYDDDLTWLGREMAEEIYERCGLDIDEDEREFDDFRYDYVENEICDILRKHMKVAMEEVAGASKMWEPPRRKRERRC